jgi:coenzyme F420-reducing hydrogenase delta subunit/ferredoxin
MEAAVSFEPRIVAFLCSWCSYTGADTAGIARLRSPANLRAVRVPCSGRVSPELVIRAFDQGADGVLVLGCHIGECHYETGNHRAARRMPILQALLSFAGLESERLRLDWVSASEGERFARIAGEFTDAVRALGPSRWRPPREEWQAAALRLETSREWIACPEADCAAKTDAIRRTARSLLEDGKVGVVIGYEVGPRGRTRPSFATTPAEAEALVWNPDCSNNLVRYVARRLRPAGEDEPQPVAVVVKPCDSRAINVKIAEGQFRREQVYAIGVACEGIRDADGSLQTRCVTCQEAAPVVCDNLIGDASAGAIPRLSSCCDEAVAALDHASPSQRLGFWLDQFDRCIRCYACRQACPMCSCPTCLYERDDSTYVGLAIGLDEKRTFHLGRAIHLAGRCVECNECERACPMGLPLSLLNHKMAQIVEEAFDHIAGFRPLPSPIATALEGEPQPGGPNA